LQAEFAKSLDAQIGIGLYPLYQMTEKARFAPEWTTDDLSAFMELYNYAMKNYKTLKPRPQVPRTGVMMLFLAVFLLPAFSLHPEEDGDVNSAVFNAADNDAADSILSKASLAVKAENWEQAVEAFALGKRTFPLDARFPRQLGDLYFRQTLYSLALDEYIIAENTGGPDKGLLNSLAKTSGVLNLYAQSARYYERIIELNPDDVDAVIDATGSLGWMYFKLHRLDDGVQLLEDAIARFGRTPDFAMTLATVYSDMYNYDKSREYYQWSINLASRFGMSSSESLAHYNMSILESKFYKYASAFAETEKSLLCEERSYGHLARGELFLRRLLFANAANDYDAALELDMSELSKISIAQARQMQGKLDEALILAQEALNAKDLSWMLNYGINVDQYKRDIFEILYNTCAGLYQKSKRSFYSGLGQTLKNKATGIKRYFQSVIYRRLYEKYSLNYAKGFNLDENAAINSSALEAFVSYGNTFDHYPQSADSYFAIARNIETGLIPQSAASWMRVYGDLKHDASLLEAAVAKLDPVWETDEIAECYEKLFHIYRKRGDRNNADASAEKLFALNRGALMQNGIALPISIAFDCIGIDNATKKRVARTMARFIKKSGFVVRAKSAYGLAISMDANGAVAEIYERASGKPIVHKTFTSAGFGKPNLIRLARLISEMTFIAESAPQGLL
jgi:hypothetical protein